MSKTAIHHNSDNRRHLEGRSYRAPLNQRLLARGPRRRAGRRSRAALKRLGLLA